MRTLASGVSTELTATTVRPRFFFQLELASTYLRVWSDTYDVSWNGSTWLGNGFLFAFGGYQEKRNIEAVGLKVTLTGEPSTLVSTILNDIRQNKTAKLWLAFLNSSGAIIADPHLLFNGRLDTATLDDAPDQSRLELALENRLIDLQRAKDYRFTHETQQIFYSGDLGFEYVEQLKEWHQYWGKK